jgi:hypothetical protein
MDTVRVAARLAELYRQREFAVARAELFAHDALHHAPARRGSLPPWSSLIARLHAIDVEEPLVAGNCFALAMALDSTVPGRGRCRLDGLCAYYLVAGDKIVSEQIFCTERG